MIEWRKILRMTEADEALSQVQLAAKERTRNVLNFIISEFE